MATRTLCEKGHIKRVTAQSPLTNSTFWNRAARMEQKQTKCHTVEAWVRDRVHWMFFSSLLLFFHLGSPMPLSCIIPLRMTHRAGIKVAWHWFCPKGHSIVIQNLNHFTIASLRCLMHMVCVCVYVRVHSHTHSSCMCIVRAVAWAPGGYYIKIFYFTSAVEGNMDDNYFRSDIKLNTDCGRFN